MATAKLEVSKLSMAVVFAVSLGAGAHAQNAEESDEAEARQEVIVVTAQKREQALTEVPMALQAYLGDELERIGLRDLSEVLRTIPGASEGLSASAGAKIFQIRGIGSIFGDSTVGYYLDDAAFSVPNVQYAPLARTFDVERVEALRGPQGTLYGQGSMGGTIRFITADPDLEEFKIRARVGAADIDGGEAIYYGDAAVSVPLIEDKLGIRLVVGQEQKGGYVDVVNFVPQEDVDDADITNVRGKVLFKPNDAVTLKALYQSSEIEQDFSALLDETDPPTLTSSGRPSFSNTDLEQISGFVGIDLGFATLENSIGQVEYLFTSDTELPLALGPGGSIVPIPSIGSQDAKTFSNETRLVSNGDSDLDWVVGVYYQDSEMEQTALIPGLVPENQSLVSQESWSVFGEVSWPLMDGKLTPLIGLRYFTDERSFFDDASTAGVAADDTNIGDTFETVNPRFNLAYTPDEDSLYYLNVAKGFRSGNFNTSAQALFGQSLMLPVESAFEPDELWSYEVGSKLVRQGGNLVFEGAIYYTEWSDIQTFLNPGLAFGLNSGEAEIYGLDFSVTSTPVEGLTLQFTGNVNSAEFTDIPVDVANAVPGDLFEEGQRLPFVPPYNFTASASYAWPLGYNELDGFAFASFTETGAQFANEIEGEEQSLLTARLGVEAENWGVYLFGDNLLDEADPIYNQFSPLLSVQTRTFPRTIGVELTFDY